MISRDSFSFLTIRYVSQDSIESFKGNRYLRWDRITLELELLSTRSAGSTQGTKRIDKVPVRSEAASKAPFETHQCGKLRRRCRLALRHAALFCTVLPRITSTIDPNALDAEPIKRPLVRLRHLPSDIPADLALSTAVPNHRTGEINVSSSVSSRNATRHHFLLLYALLSSTRFVSSVHSSLRNSKKLFECERSSSGLAVMDD